MKNTNSTWQDKLRLSIITAILVITNLLFLPLTINAQGSEVKVDPLSGKSNLYGINLQAIRIPTFISADFAKNFSIFSYIGLAVGLGFVALTTYWVVVMIMAAVDIIKAGNDDKPIEEAKRKFSNIAAGIGMLVGFFAIVSLVGGFIGVGNFWDWPKSFSQCEDKTFYYTKVLELGTRDERVVDAACF